MHESRGSYRGMRLRPHRSTEVMARRWSAELELVGAGGEPVDLWRTLTSHGVADLPPSVIDEENARVRSRFRYQGAFARLDTGLPGGPARRRFRCSEINSESSDPSK